jgi:outer membrane protein, multidrug efflux system
MMSKRMLMKSGLSRAFGSHAQRCCLLMMAAGLPACINGPAVDLAPDYQPTEFVVPDSWHGASPFVEAKPSDGELRPDWWEIFADPVLNKLEEQAMAANPDLQAAAERFVQARDEMMKARSGLIPHLGLEYGMSNNRQSENSLFHAQGSPIQDSSVAAGGIASWEPDFWSAIRNRTRMEIFRAEQRAADFGLARLSLQAEIASNYFTLRGYDAQNAIYKQSIDYYKKSLAIVYDQFTGKIGSGLDVARAEYLLSSTEAKKFDIQGRRQVVEHALAILVNKVPASFNIEPVDELRMEHFKVPRSIPSTLLERRPDIAAMEREMAQANRVIGIARAAFFPKVSFRFGGGYEDNGFNLVTLANSLWSYGSNVSLPIFQGGYRRAQLQQSWAAYRETEDKYRATVLNAFREVENGLSLTSMLFEAAGRQDTAVGAAVKTQNLSMDLFRGGLSSSLDLLYAQLSTLTSRIDAVTIKADLLRSEVGLVRSLGGGWNRKQLPDDEQIQPFDVLQYQNLAKPEPAGGINVNAENNGINNDLTKSAVP